MKMDDALIGALMAGSLGGAAISALAINMERIGRMTATRDGPSDNSRGPPGAQGLKAWSSRAPRRRRPSLSRHEPSFGIKILSR